MPATLAATAVATSRSLCMWCVLGRRTVVRFSW